MGSASAAQGFAGSDPGRRHGAAHQATMRRHPTCHNQRHSQLESTTIYLGALGRRRKKKVLLKKIYKIDKPIASLIRKKKKRKKKIYINNTRTERGDINTNSKDIKRKKRKYCHKSISIKSTT